MVWQPEDTYICPECDFIEPRLSGKMKYNIMNCFHTFMNYAWRAKRIKEMPPFPEKSDLWNS